MPPKPKTEEERLKYRILELEAENAILKKIAKTQPTKNAEKAAITKALCIYFPLTILLDLISLVLSVFFYHLKTKNDKNAAISQEIAIIYHDNHGNYGYRRVTFNLRETIKINHKKVQRIIQ